MTDVVCSQCGSKSVEYRFGFNKGLAAFLLKLFEANGPAKTDDLNLTYAQRTNSQKLRYWGLAEASADSGHHRRRGWWVITDKGRYFVQGRIGITRYVVMKNNKRVRYEGENIQFHEVCEGYQVRGDYQDQARQQILF